MRFERAFLEKETSGKDPTTVVIHQVQKKTIRKELTTESHRQLVPSLETISSVSPAYFWLTVNMTIATQRKILLNTFIIFLRTSVMHQIPKFKIKYSGHVDEICFFQTFWFWIALTKQNWALTLSEFFKMQAIPCLTKILRLIMQAFLWLFKWNCNSYCWIFYILHPKPN